MVEAASIITTEKRAIKDLFLFIYWLRILRFKDAVFMYTVAEIIFAGISGKNKSNDHLVLT